MVLTNDQVNEQLRRFYEEVRQHVPVQAFILFGSYACGNPRPWSDIDVAVISPAWQEMSRQERLTLLGRWAWNAGTLWIEAVGYTPEEFAQAVPGSFVGDIREEGLVLRDGKIIGRVAQVFDG